MQLIREINIEREIRDFDKSQNCQCDYIFREVKQILSGHTNFEEPFRP